MHNRAHGRTQAAVVADSPFYKLLIGRMMGYNEGNILHHIKVRLGLLWTQAKWQCCLSHVEV